MTENQNSPTNQGNSWTQSEKADISKFLTVLINGQKAYGRNISLKDTMDFFRFKLEGRYTASSVLKALSDYSDKKNDMPAPADLIAIMNPEKPRISQAEFIHAKKQWELEGYPSYSYYAMIVKDYENENHEERVEHGKIEDKRLLEIVQNSVKRIS